MVPWILDDFKGLRVRRKPFQDSLRARQGVKRIQVDHQEGVVA